MYSTLQKYNCFSAAALPQAISLSLIAVSGVDFLAHIPAPPFTSWLTMGKLTYLSVPWSPNMKEKKNSACILDCLAKIMPVKFLTQFPTKNKIIAHYYYYPNIKEEETGA